MKYQCLILLAVLLSGCSTYHPVDKPQPAKVKSAIRPKKILLTGIDYLYVGGSAADKLTILQPVTADIENSVPLDSVDSVTYTDQVSMLNLLHSVGIDIPNFESLSLMHTSHIDLVNSLPMGSFSNIVITAVYIKLTEQNLIQTTILNIDILYNILAVTNQNNTSHTINEVSSFNSELNDSSILNSVTSISNQNNTSHTINEVSSFNSDLNDNGMLDSVTSVSNQYISQELINTINSLNLELCDIELLNSVQQYNASLLTNSLLPNTAVVSANLATIISIDKIQELNNKLMNLSPLVQSKLITNNFSCTAIKYKLPTLSDPRPDPVTELGQRYLVIKGKIENDGYTQENKILWQQYTTDLTKAMARRNRSFNEKHIRRSK